MTTRFLGYTQTIGPFQTSHVMPNYVKLILACLLCLAVITGLVLLVRHFF